jgi:hypothetical protein
VLSAPGTSQLSVQHMCSDVEGNSQALADKLYQILHFERVGPTQNMFEARLAQGSLLKRLAEALKELVGEVNFNVNSAGMTCQVRTLCVRTWMQHSPCMQAFLVCRCSCGCRPWMAHTCVW